MRLYSLAKIEYSLTMKETLAVTLENINTNSESILLTQTRGSALLQTSLLCFVLLCLAFVWMLYLTRDEYTREENFHESRLLKISWALVSTITLFLFLRSLVALC